jgi:predicted SprT family Zn-dependent metalloprotease
VSRAASRSELELETEALSILAEVREHHPEHAAALATVRVRISRRLVRSAGNADPRLGLVQLSEPIFRLEENAPMFRNTVLHELAHVIAGPEVRAHGREWRAIFLALGGDGRRTHSLRAAGEHRLRPARCVRCAGTVEIGPRRLRRLIHGHGRYIHVGCGGRIVPLPQEEGRPRARRAAPRLADPRGRATRGVDAPRSEG